MSTNTKMKALGRAIAEVEIFAEKVEVDAELQPIRFRTGEVAGLELTRLFAAFPGNGAGTKVMAKLLEVARSFKLPVYLRPSSDESREFYCKFGFETLEHAEELNIKKLDDEQFNAELAEMSVSEFKRWNPGFSEREAERRILEAKAAPSSRTMVLSF